MKLCLYALVVTTFFCSDVFGSNDGSEKKYDIAKDLIHTYSGKGDNYEKVKNLAEEIFWKDSNDPYSYLILAELKARQYKDYKTGNPLEIWMLTNRAASLNGDIAGVYVIESKMANLDNDIDMAREKLNIALKLEPENKEAMFEAAQIEQKLKNYELSEKWFRKLIKSHDSVKRKSNIYYWLGQMFLAQTPPKIEEAKLAMKKGVDLSPNAPWKLYNYSAFLNTYTNDFKSSAKYSRAALKEKEFSAAKSALAMAMYSVWADKFLLGELGKQVGENELLNIETETEIAPDYAYRYIEAYMPFSQFPKAYRAYKSKLPLNSSKK